MAQDTVSEFVAATASKLGVPGVAVGVWADGREADACHGVTSVDNPPPRPELRLTDASCSTTPLLVPERGFAVVSLSNAFPDGPRCNQAVVRRAFEAHLGLGLRERGQDAHGQHGRGRADLRGPDATGDPRGGGQGAAPDHPPADVGLLPGGKDESIITSGGLKGLRGGGRRPGRSPVHPRWRAGGSTMTEGPGAEDARGQDLAGLGELERRVLLDWVGENLAQVRRSVYGQQLLYRSLVVGFVVGLAVHVGGYALRSSVSTGPLGLVADLLYALGYALWTGVVVAVFVQVFPEVKRRQFKQALETYEAARRDQASRDDQAPTTG